MDIHQPTFSSLSLLTSVKLRPTLGGVASAELTAAVLLSQLWIFVFSQNSENKLFILRDCLGSAGSFLLLLVHCLAHITAADFNQDTNPIFLRLFYQVHQYVPNVITSQQCQDKKHHF